MLRVSLCSRQHHFSFTAYGVATEAKLCQAEIESAAVLMYLLKLRLYLMLYRRVKFHKDESQELRVLVNIFKTMNAFKNYSVLVYGLSVFDVTTVFRFEVSALMIWLKG